MKLALLIFIIISQVSLWIFILGNCLRLFKKATFGTKITIIVSGMVTSLASIPEIILNILLGQSYAYSVAKLIVFAILSVLNIILVYKETKLNPSSKKKLKNCKNKK